MAGEAALKNAEAKAAAQRQATSPRSGGKKGGSPLAALPGAKPRPPGSAVAQVPQVEPLKDFSLSRALDKAYTKVSEYLSGVLDERDMDLTLGQEEGGAVVGTVTDRESGRFIRTYGGEEMLRLYARNQQERGIIVDGKV